MNANTSLRLLGAMMLDADEADTLRQVVCAVEMCGEDRGG